MFETTALNQRNRRVENRVKLVFLAMTLLLILPVLIILTVLVVKGGPVVSFDFLFTEPTHGMTAGGILPALVGTVWLVVVALLASVPFGVAAALYLSEYAADNWLTRIINLAVVHRPCPVRGGCVCPLLSLRYQHPGRQLDLGGDDAAGGHRLDAGSLAGGAPRLSRGLLEHGGDPLADHPQSGAAQLHQRHPHRCHSRGFEDGR
jgi:hypothetical protein